MQGREDLPVFPNDFVGNISIGNSGFIMVRDISSLCISWFVKYHKACRLASLFLTWELIKGPQYPNPCHGVHVQS